MAATFSDASSAATTDMAATNKVHAAGAERRLGVVGATIVCLVPRLVLINGILQKSELDTVVSSVCTEYAGKFF